MYKVINDEISLQLSSDKKSKINQESHEYHEISDDEAMQSDKMFDFGPSLLDEMSSMLRSMTTSGESSLGPPLTPNFDNVNKRNEMTELSSKLNRESSGAGGLSFTSAGKQINACR